MVSMWKRLAPAKVNLFLHVAAPDARHYHPLQSLVGFCDFGDELLFEPNNSRKFELIISGAFADGLSVGGDNLVSKAVRAFEVSTGVVVGGKVYLEKSLPIASGIGGGTSDAGAMLRLLRQHYAPEMADAQLESIAASLGADGVMCLWAKSCFATHYGEVAHRIEIPKLPIVMINPIQSCSTADIFRGYDACGQFSELIESVDQYNNINIDQLIAKLLQKRNDLQGVATEKLPVIATILELLSSYPSVKLARMSGSGATCFAICDSHASATNLGDKLKAMWPNMWVKSGILG